MPEHLIKVSYYCCYYYPQLFPKAILLKAELLRQKGLPSPSALWLPNYLLERLRQSVLPPVNDSDWFFSTPSPMGGIIMYLIFAN